VGVNESVVYGLLKLAGGEFLSVPPELPEPYMAVGFTALETIGDGHK
jgi:hypothetical protein